MSYSHKDSNRVYPVLDALYDKKYRIWYDESCENGNDFRDELHVRIEAADAILVFVSQNSMASPFCGMEIIVARENGKRLYPIYLDNVELPPAFQLLFANTHHSTADNLDKLVRAMVRDLPATAMDRLTKNNDVVERCEDNGTDIEIDEGIRIIADGAFKDRIRLHHIKLPSTLEEIGEESFRGCRNLEEMDVPEKTVKIHTSAFRDCVSMKSLVVRNNCIKIGERAFENCSALEEVQLPSTVSNIGDAPFRGCSAIRSIQVDSKNKYYKSAPIKRDGSNHVLFNKNKSILIAYPASSREVQYDIPDSVVSVCDWAFCESKKLNRITIPDSVREIGEGAFSNCSLLDELEIPDSVERIDDCAFRGCTSLEKIIIPDSVVELGWGLFDGCEKTVVVYCNEGSAIYDYCIRNKIRQDRIQAKDNI